jgi:D-alanyl-D-alanine carboxypeptidase
MTARVRRTVAAVVVTTALLALPACQGSGTQGNEPSPSRSTAAVTTTAPPVAHVDTLPAPPTRGLPRATVRRLDRVLSARVKAGDGVSGLTAAVVTDEGRWAGAAGISGAGERLTPRSSLAMGSITKTFMAAEVMHLVSEGLVDLDARLSSYVTLPVKDNGARVHDALHMRSGIRNYFNDEMWEAADSDPGKHMTGADALRFTPPEVDKAGAFFEYSNTNFVLLGQLIEKVTGKSLAAAVHEDLLAPTGLTRVAVQDEDRPVPPLAHLNPHLAPTGPYLPTRALAGLAGAAGGMTADAGSVAQWGYLLFGARVLPAETVARMLPVLGTVESQYGLGVMGLTSNNSSDVEYVGHRGEIGAYESLLVKVRDEPVSIAVMLTAKQQKGIGDPQEVVDALADIVLAAR